MDRGYIPEAKQRQGIVTPSISKQLWRIIEGIRVTIEKVLLCVV
jgi:hypothetical protein